METLENQAPQESVKENKKKKEKQEESKNYILQDVEVPCISVIKIPSASEIGSFNYSVIKFIIKNGQVIAQEMSAPTVKQFAQNEAKIQFVKTFFQDDLGNFMKEHHGLKS